MALFYGTSFLFLKKEQILQMSSFYFLAQNPANLTHVAMKASCLHVGLLKPGDKLFFLFSVTMHVTLKNGHRHSLQKLNTVPRQF